MLMMPKCIKSSSPYFSHETQFYILDMFIQMPKMYLKVNSSQTEIWIPATMPPNLLFPITTKILGTIIDSLLCQAPYIQSISKFCIVCFQNFPQIHLFFFISTATTLIEATTISHLNDCHSLLTFLVSFLLCKNLFSIQQSYWS